jgi:ligand-binding sensor domain-containing protein
MRLLLALLLAALLACRFPAASPNWVRDDAGLPGYAIATGMAVGPDETVYVSLYREDGVVVRRAGEGWVAPSDLAGVAGYGVAAAPQAGIALAATVDGVYRTEDAGRRWTRTSARQPISAVAIAPDGMAAWAGGEGELLRSGDGGRSWTSVALFDPQVAILGLAPTRDGLAVATAGGGIRLVRDDGVHLALPTRQVVSSIAADREGRLVARVEGRLWSSATGEVWEPGASFARPVVAVGAAGDFLLAATEGAGVFRSRDGGASWTSVGGPLGATVYAVAGGERVWAATGHGVLVASDNRWETTGEGFGRPLVRGLAAEGALFAATSDGVYRREEGGWRPLSRDLRDVLTLFVLPTSGAIYAGTFERGIVRSVDGGRSWETVTEAEYRRAIVPVITAGEDTLVARVEYDRTLQSRDRGATWALADAGLEGRTVFAVASDGQTFWAGTDEGVFRLDGSLWRALPPLSGSVSALVATSAGLAAGTSDGVWLLDASRWQRAGLDGRHVVALLLGADGHLEIAGTSSDGVFRREGGAWRPIGLAHERINALARDPRDGALVVATEGGVWRAR